MSKRSELLESIADRIADYREGDVPQRTPKVVEKWIDQFPDKAQDGILAEVDHLLSETYISREEMASFLRGLATHTKFCKDDPEAFWRSANLLDIQKGGNSQREILAMFGEILQEKVGIELSDCGTKDGPFVYLDDGLFGGGRVLQDLTAWIEKAPSDCELHVVVAALHASGQYYVDKKLQELKARTKKKIKVTWWRIHEIENRRYFKDESDVLWPTEVPSGPLANAYVRYITEQEPKYKVELRSPGSVGKKKFFSSDSARILLEQHFLIAGLQIRDRSSQFPETIRPLGATLLKTFGFGSSIVTFRNCPNNCPLVFWAGDPWFPLFPRSTNSDSFMKRLLASFRQRKGKKK